MIYIDRISRPEELTDKVVEELTEKYKIKASSVWNEDFIKNALLKMTNNKCCYCESPLNVRGAYMEVEHFHPKSLYPDEVVAWDNLLPVCKNCNLYKKDLDTKSKNVFIDPSKENPQDHFATKAYRYKSKDDLGKLVIRRLQLNALDTLGVARYKVNDAIVQKMEGLYESVLSNKDNADELSYAINELRELLKLVQKDKPYSAVTSSTLLYDSDYKKIKEVFKVNGCWDEDIERLEQGAENIAFDQAI